MRRLLLALGLWCLTTVPCSAIVAHVQWSLSARDLRALNLTMAQISSVQLSADGKRLFLLAPVAPHLIRLLVLDVASHRSVKNFLIDAGEINSLAVNANGSRAFLLANIGREAFWFDVASGRSTLAFSKSSSHFRFGLPLAASFMPDGRVHALGYFLNEAGQTTGDAVAVLSPAEGARPLLELRPLEKATHAVGRLPEVVQASAAPGRVAFVTQTPSRAAQAYVSSGSRPLLLEEADRIRGLTMDDAGTCVFYYTLRGSQGQLVMAALPSGQHLKEWNGWFVPPSISADGRRLLVARIATVKPLMTVLMFASEATGWKLQDVQVPGHTAPAQNYALMPDGHTFLLWAPSDIVVGTLP